MRNRTDSSGDPAARYAARIHRAIDHVTTDLTRPLRLEDLAQVAGFSPYHFHRLFRAQIGEPLAQFVNRLRLERALYLMCHDPRRPLTDVALACGFSSSSAFSRSFKQRYGVAPSAFDLESHREENARALGRHMERAGEPLERLDTGENPDGFQASVRRLPPRTLAYVRVLDPFSGTGVVDASARLVAWAEARGAADGRWFGYMWEDPELVALADCRYDVAVELPADSPCARAGREPEDEVGRLRLPSMDVAEVRVRGDIQLEQRALDWLFRTWLPASGYLPADFPCFEAWVGRPFAHGSTYFELDIQLPVQRDRA